MVECFLLNFPVNSWISSLVFTLLDCVNSSAMFGTVNCKMVFPYIGYISTFIGVYSSSLYGTIGVGMCDFGIFLGAGAGVVKLLGSFNLGDAVVMGGL